MLPADDLNRHASTSYTPSWPCLQRLFALSSTILPFAHVNARQPDAPSPCHLNDPMAMSTMTAPDWIADSHLRGTPGLHYSRVMCALCAALNALANKAICEHLPLLTLSYPRYTSTSAISFDLLQTRADFNIFNPTEMGLYFRMATEVPLPPPAASTSFLSTSISRTTSSSSKPHVDILPANPALLSQTEAGNAKKLVELDQRLQEANKTEGESDISEALRATADRLTPIGHKKQAVEVQTLAFEKAPDLGPGSTSC